MHLSLASLTKFEVTIYASGPPPKKASSLRWSLEKACLGGTERRRTLCPPHPGPFASVTTALRSAPGPGHQFAELNSAKYLVSLSWESGGPRRESRCAVPSRNIMQAVFKIV